MGKSIAYDHPSSDDQLSYAWDLLILLGLYVCTWVNFPHPDGAFTLWLSA
jgi:hypothetical protein